jgi:hypothetical protein
VGEDAAASGKAAAAVDVLDSSVDNLQGVARPAGAVAASSSAVSHSRGCFFADWSRHVIAVTEMFDSVSFLVSGRRKKSRPTRSFVTDQGTFWKTRPVSPASGRADAWGKLISQSSEVCYSTQAVEKCFGFN